MGGVLLISEALSNCSLSTFPRLADSGSLPPIQLGTIERLTFDFRTSTFMSLIITSSSWRPARVKLSPGSSLEMNPSSMMPI